MSKITIYLEILEKRCLIVLITCSLYQPKNRILRHKKIFISLKNPAYQLEKTGLSARKPGFVNITKTGLQA